MMLSRRTYQWFEAIHAASQNLPPDEMAEFLAWDADRPEGLGTVDWPGFRKYVPPQAEFIGTVVKRERGTNQRTERRLPFRAVWDRDDWTCQGCGTHRNLTIDHVRPVALGGSDDLDNLQTLCGSCNSRKGARV